MVGFWTCITVVLLDSLEIRVELCPHSHPVPSPLLGAMEQALLGKIMALTHGQSLLLLPSHRVDGPHDTLTWKQKKCGEQLL